jgi:hypothetical protein
LKFKFTLVLPVIALGLLCAAPLVATARAGATWMAFDVPGTAPTRFEVKGNEISVDSDMGASFLFHELSGPESRARTLTWRWRVDMGIPATDLRTRHAEAYARYLDHLGGARTVDANFGQALNQALEWSGPPQAWMLGFHVLLEGEALRTLADFQEFWPCPVFRRMNALISRDEARHVAFGKLFLRDTLPRMAAAERRAIYHQLDVFWRDVGGGLLADTRVPGIFTRGLRQRWLDDGWRHHCRAFADVGLLPSRQISEGAAA